MIYGHDSNGFILKTITHGCRLFWYDDDDCSVHEIVLGSTIHDSVQNKTGMFYAVGNDCLIIRTVSGLLECKPENCRLID